MRPRSSLMLLVGNKSDNGRMLVPQTRIAELAATFRMTYVETSAKQNFQIRYLFQLAENHVSSKLHSGEIVPNPEVTFRQ